MRITLTVIDGPHQGRQFAFARHDTFLVGRSAHAHFQLPLKDKYFSRIHFLVEMNPPQCRLVDMGSRNGTFLNGQRVLSAYLNDGDQIQAGHTMLRLHLEPDTADILLPKADVRPGAMSAGDASAELSAEFFPGYRLGKLIGTGTLGRVYQVQRLADATPLA